MTTMPSPLRATSLALALALSVGGVVACGSPSDTPADIQQQSLTTNKDNNPTIAPLGDTNPTMKTQEAPSSAKLVPVAMRTGTHQGFDRVVIELAGEGTPGWHVDYTQLPTQQASGLELKVNGESFLNVNIDGTTYPFELGLEATDLPPVAGQGPAVAEVISGGTFEGRSQFIIGLNGGHHPYSVSFLENPKRLVIDFKQN